jgi:hypothetical protein
MSLPNMEIYKFGKWWQTSVMSWLQQNGINDVKKQKDSSIDLADGKTATLKTPRVEAKWLGGGFARELYYVVPQTSQRWLNIYSGIGYLKIVTRRGESETHDSLEALCRYLMQQVTEISSKMNYHVIEKMLEQSSTISFEADKNHDVSSLSFQTDIRIRTGAFPTT